MEKKLPPIGRNLRRHAPAVVAFLLWAGVFMVPEADGKTPDALTLPNGSFGDEVSYASLWREGDGDWNVGPGRAYRVNHSAVAPDEFGHVHT
ncbi:MAG TPA: hypothetical protein VGB18_09200, partial [Candidatus Thermoplasmatota archaeon]